MVGGGRDAELVIKISLISLHYEHSPTGTELKMAGPTEGGVNMFSQVISRTPSKAIVNEEIVDCWLT